MINRVCQWFYSQHAKRREEEIVRRFVRGQKTSGISGQDVIYHELQAVWNDLDLLEGIDFPARKMARDAWNDAPLYRPDRQHFRLNVAAVACCLIAIVTVWHVDPWPLQEATYETFDGKSIELPLADGSMIHMNTGSHLKVRLYRSRREVVLYMGEAFFKVYPDPDKPFTVIAGNSSVRAVGTAFNVYKKADEIEVAVSEGKVEVTMSSEPEKFLLQEGDSLLYNENKLLSLTTLSVDKIAAWRTGRIVFQEMPLSEVMLELRRYGFDKSVSLDDDIAGLKLSGSFSIKNPKALLRTLPDVLPIDINEDSNHISITSKY